MMQFIILFLTLLLPGCFKKAEHISVEEQHISAPMRAHSLAIQPQVSNLATATVSNHPLMDQLKQEEAKVWNMLHRYNVTPEGYKKFAQLFPEFVQPRRHKLSQETVQIIYDIFKDFNIDRKKIALASYVDPYSPAAVEHNVIFIDETLLKQYSKKAQRFIIAHEIQHILHKDVILGTFAEQKLPKANKKSFDHPMNRLRRFQERRADLMTITKAPHYAQGQIEFLETYLTQFGSGNGIAHPKATTRLAYAKDIATAHNQTIV